MYVLVFLIFDIIEHILLNHIQYYSTIKFNYILVVHDAWVDTSFIPEYKNLGDIF